MIRYEKGLGGYNVYLDDKHVGTIRPLANGNWQYKPSGSKLVGQEFESLSACKASLEQEQATA